MDQNYYLFKSGRLKRKDDSLIFYFDDNKDYKYLPVEGVDAFYVFGELDLNSKCLNFLGKKEIPIHFFNYYGFYTGSFYPKETLISGHLLVKQVAHYSDMKKRLHLAKMLLEGAVYNIRTNLKYYNTKSGDFSDTISKIEALTPSLHSATSTEQLMGIEGNIRQHYYSAFTGIIKQDLEFKKRVKRPPDNIINTMISFLNTLTYTTCLSELYKTQLNPTISFLHEPGERRFSLSLDIAEIFKPLLADRVLFTLLNKKQITEDQFEKGSEGLFLTEKGKKTIIQAFDEKLKTKVKHKHLKRTVSYQYLIRLECYKLIKHILNEKPYEGFKIYW